MQMLTTKNIIISGWPGAGSSTLAMSLADALNMKYLYAGGVWKYLARQVVGTDSGPDFIQFENEYGKYWDNIWESYVKVKLANDKNILLDGKTAGFLLFGDNLYKIMVTASIAARVSRAKHDQRADAENTIKARDIEVRQRWIDNLKVDIYDLELIQRLFNYHLDNSELEVEQEIAAALNQLATDQVIPSAAALGNIAHTQTTLFHQHGKLAFKQNLTNKGLIITEAEVFRDWQSLVPEVFASLPQILKQHTVIGI